MTVVLVATVLTVLDEIASLLLQYASVDVAREFVGAAACEKLTLRYR